MGCGRKEGLGQGLEGSWGRRWGSFLGAAAPPAGCGGGGEAKRSWKFECLEKRNLEYLYFWSLNGSSKVKQVHFLGQEFLCA